MAFDINQLPLYGCLTGITLPSDYFELSSGLTLERTFVDTFAARMMAFKEPEPGKAHPTPWAAVAGSSDFECRVQLSIKAGGLPDGFSPPMTAWLVAALLRLAVTAPIRIPVLASKDFAEIPKNWQETSATSYETAPTQWGIFSDKILELTEEQLQDVKLQIPVAARLYHDDRFQRAFSIYDEALWSPRKEHATVLVWTALEVLFDASAEQNKTKAISESVSSWIGADASDRDRAYNVVRELYQKRGRVVHVGKKLDNNDFIQSLMIARAVFGNTLNREQLPPLRAQTAH